MGNDDVRENFIMIWECLCVDDAMCGKRASVCMRFCRKHSRHPQKILQQCAQLAFPVFPRAIQCFDKCALRQKNRFRRKASYVQHFGLVLNGGGLEVCVCLCV